jgi:hypothetical protein
VTSRERLSGSASRASQWGDSRSVEEGVTADGVERDRGIAFVREDQVCEGDQTFLVENLDRAVVDLDLPAIRAVADLVPWRAWGCTIFPVRQGSAMSAESAGDRRPSNLLRLAPAKGVGISSDLC